MEWVSVGDSMPEIDEPVIINIDFSCSSVTPLVVIGKWTGSEFKIGPNSVMKRGNDKVAVTHWSPLPKSP